MYMMSVLEQARKHLPRYLEEDLATWNSMYITYEFPHVRRLWRTLNDNYRLYLHVIEAIPRGSGARPFLHKHPWPSAVMVLNGRYYMELIKNGSKNNFIFDGGSSYSMEDPNDEHFVQPLDGEVLSIMVTGKPYSIEGWQGLPKSDIPKQAELPLDEQKRMIQAFKTLFYIRPRIGLE